MPAHNETAVKRTVRSAESRGESGRQISCTSTKPPWRIGNSRTTEITACCPVQLEQLTLSRGDIPHVTTQAPGKRQAVCAVGWVEARITVGI